MISLVFLSSSFTEIRKDYSKTYLENFPTNAISLLDKIKPSEETFTSKKEKIESIEIKEKIEVKEIKRETKKKTNKKTIDVTLFDKESVKFTSKIESSS
jgi:hypothetical protein